MKQASIGNVNRVTTAAVLDVMSGIFRNPMSFQEEPL